MIQGLLSRMILTTPWLWLAVGWLTTWLLRPYLGATAWLAIPGVLVLVWIADRVLFANKRLLFLLFLLVPLSVPLGESGVISFPGELIAAVLVGGWLVRLGLAGKISRSFLLHPVTLLVLADLAWMTLATINSTLPMVSFKRLIIRFIFAGAFFGLTAQLLTTEKDWIKAFVLYAIGVVPVILLSLFRHAEYGFSQGASLYLMQPFFPEHTLYGACLALVFTVLAVWVWKAKTIGLKQVNGYFTGLVVLFSIVLLGLIFSYSRGAWISIGPAILLLILLRLGASTRHLAGLVALLGIGLLIFQAPLQERLEKVNAVSNQGQWGAHLGSVANISSDVSNLERLNRWQSALAMAAERPITGFGPGTYQFKYAVYQQRQALTRISTFDGDKGNAHSEYLGLVSEAGWPALFILFGLILAVYHTGIQAWRKTRGRPAGWVVMGLLMGLTTFFTHGWFNSFWDADQMAILVFGAMGGLVAFDLRFRASA